MNMTEEIAWGKARSSFYSQLHLLIGSIADECNVSSYRARQIAMSAMGVVLTQAIENSAIPSEKENAL